MAESYTILGDKVHVYKRPNSTCWQCSSYLAGRNRRTTTKEESLSKAKVFAEDWYLQLRGKLRSGELKSGKTFREAAEQYLREYDIITRGQRSKTYLRGQHARANGHLVPFFGRMILPEINAGKVQDYRIHRLQEATATRGKLPRADIYQIAKNYHTSVEMIEKYYAAHLMTPLDASAINVMWIKPKKKKIPGKTSNLIAGKSRKNGV